MKLIFKNKYPKYLIIAVFSIIYLLKYPLFLVADEITWMITDWKPCAYFENGKYKGYDIEMIKLIQAELPEYNHKFLEANSARIMKTLKDEEYVCSFGYMKNAEREKFANFSIPSAYFFPNVIFMRKETHNELGTPNNLSLSKLLSYKKLKFGIKGKRSYGKSIDKILTKYKGSERIFIGYQGNETKSMIKMLAAKRFDILIEYPDVGEVIAKEAGVEKKLVSVLIKEKKNLSWSYIAFPKTEWGRKMVVRINTILLKIRGTKKYRQTYEKVLNNGLIPTYRKAYSKFFLKQVK
ncbi:MAG: TIGR02285 family protein [Desulfobacterales bacterium]|nr:TIGR02285 family protein [Desulfobacterales bacterium]MCP4164258.1 TIGR02285 family protein [Deltaproteobacteria bacterium]